MNEKIIKKTLVTIVIAFTYCSFSSASTTNSSMNDIKLTDYKDFEKEWKFVTVRFRKDTGEMRFTYANPKAWQALKAGGKSYPDGSVFGKVSVRTQVDPVFPSSKVPSGKRRVQFMVRDQDKYKKTYGWGYALFAANGLPFEGNHATKSMACAACHKIVEDQGHVFSKPMSFNTQLTTGTDWRARVLFETKPVSTLPVVVQKRLPPSIKSIELIQGALTEHLFYGTLDEIRPILLEQAKARGNASGLVSKDGSQFSVVFPNRFGPCVKKFGKDTSKRVKYFKAFHSVPNKKRPILEIDICE